MSVVWRKSSYSDNGGDGDCVEVALNGSTAYLRDSKSKATTVNVSGWAEFLGAIKRGDLGQV